MRLLLRWAIEGDLCHAHSLYLGHMGQDFSRLRQPEMEVWLQFSPLFCAPISHIYLIQNDDGICCDV
jgi:hypothetical protein